MQSRERAGNSREKYRHVCPSAALEEARLLLRASHAIHTSAADPAYRKQVLVRSICDMAGAVHGVCVVTHHDARTGRNTVLSKVPVGDPAHDITPNAVTGRSNGKPPETHPGQAAREQSPTCEPVGVGLFDWSGGGRGLESRVELSEPGVLAQIVVGGGRCAVTRPSARQRRLIDLLHAESAWVYAPDLLLVSPESLALSAREREVLLYLLNGDAEKQIAVRTGSSANTIHHHVKAVYRHFGVSSRAELLSLWVKKAWKA